MVSDSELMKQCRMGDPKYQEMLYQRFSPTLFAVALRYARNYDDAQDILHDAFVKILTNLDSFNENGSLEGWMHAIVVNTAINAYHKKQKMNGTIDIDEVSEQVGDVTIRQKDFLSENILLQFVNELPDGYRTVFNLFEIDGYSHKEISEITGSSYTTVRTQLFKAKRALKKKIEDFFKSSPDEMPTSIRNKEKNEK